MVDAYDADRSGGLVDAAGHPLAGKL